MTFQFWNGHILLIQTANQAFIEATDIYLKSFTTFMFFIKPDSAYNYDTTALEVGCNNSKTTQLDKCY